jgi:formylglycine-generating enzyme required for sulfatase activity
MKFKFLAALLLLLAVAGQPARPQEAAKPLNKNQVMELVKAGMESAELAEKVKQLGIDFDLTDDYLQALRKAGAQDVLIQALRAARPMPLTKEQILELVAGHVPSQRAAALVKQHGIDFSPDQEYLQTLRVAGAEEELLAALRDAAAAVEAELLVVTSPSAEVFLDGESQGRTNFEGHLMRHARLGVHVLRVSLPGKKDFSRSVTVVAQKTTFVQARLEDLAPTSGIVRENPIDSLKYVWIPPGTFMMGCSPGDNDCFYYEKPPHRMTLTKGFWIGQSEVTVAAYKRFADSAGKALPPFPDFNAAWTYEQLPIVNVSWDDAQAYCAWAGGRLPTEAEWEYAARGGSTEPRYGDLDDIAWYMNNSRGQPHPVGEKRANGFGLYDMLGKVWEWVNDWYEENNYQYSLSQDYTGPVSGQYRVLRGGSWISDPGVVRVSFRVGDDPGGRDHGNGFRCGGEVFAR